MSPILQGLTGLTFLMAAESGIIVSNFSRSTTREMIWVYNAAVGYDIGFVGHNPEASYTVSGKKSGTGGLAAAAPCVALTLAGPTFGNGVGIDATDNGTVWTQTVGLSHAEKGFRELNISAMQKPGITYVPA